MSNVIQAESRERTTKSHLRQLRLHGNIPAVIYGNQIETGIPISVKERDLLAAIRTSINAVIELDIPAKGKFTAMVSEVQQDPMINRITHVDFQQVNMNESIRANIRVQPEGDAVGVKEGGMLQMVMFEIEVECLPGSIPDAVVADMTQLGIGNSLLVSDLALPSGVKVLDDANQVVATILAPQKALDAEEAEDAAVNAIEAESRSKEAQMQETKSL